MPSSMLRRRLRAARRASRPAARSASAGFGRYAQRSASSRRAPRPSPWCRTHARANRPARRARVASCPVAPLAKCTSTAAASRGSGGGLCSNSRASTSAIGPPRLTSASIRCRPAPVSPPPGDSFGSSRQPPDHARRVLVAEMRLDVQHLADRPSATTRRNSSIEGKQRLLLPSANTTPALRHAATARSASAQRQRERLLAPHRLAGRRDRDDLVDMKRMRRRQHAPPARADRRPRRRSRWRAQNRAPRRNRGPGPAPC